MKNASSFLVKQYHSESTRKSQEKKYVRFVNLPDKEKPGAPEWRARKRDLSG